MEFKIECPWCNQHYSVDESFIGQNVECSVCGKLFPVRKPTVSAPTIEKTIDFSSNQAHNPAKKAFTSKNTIRNVIIGCAVLVVVAVSICIVYFVRYIPEKEYKNGLKAHDEHRYEEAVEFFQKAAEHGHEEAKNKYKKTLAEINCNKGKKAFVEHRYTEAVEHLQKAADFGDSDAQVLLGLCYFNGEGIIKNSDEAVIWFRKAAEQNNPQAQFRLGLCYLAGIGVNPREEEGLYWLQKATEQRNLEAQIALGDFYYNKGKTLENFSEALKWYQIAEETGIISDESKAKKTMCRVFQNAYSGDTTAQLAVVAAYEGELFGLKKDEKEAKKWLIKAADSGDPKAQGLLGAALMRSGDEEEALKWLNKAGKQEDIDAMMLLAIYYSEKSKRESGFEAYFSLEESKEWYDKVYAARAAQAKKDKEDKNIDKASLNSKVEEDTHNQTVDKNGNEIPDEWEKEHNVSIVSANSDEDSDGFNLIQEYNAKTDPTDSLSHPKYITQVYVSAVSRTRFNGLELVSVDRAKPDKKDWLVTFNVLRNGNKRSAFIQIDGRTFSSNSITFSILDIEIDEKTQEPIVYIQRIGKADERIVCRVKQPVYDPAPRVRLLNSLYDRTITASVGAEFTLGTYKTGEERYKVVSADPTTKLVVVESISAPPETFTIQPTAKATRSATTRRDDSPYLSRQR